MKKNKLFLFLLLTTLLPLSQTKASSLSETKAAPSQKEPLMNDHQSSECSSTYNTEFEDIVNSIDEFIIIAPCKNFLIKQYSKDTLAFTFIGNVIFERKKKNILHKQNYNISSLTYALNDIQEEKIKSIKITVNHLEKLNLCPCKNAEKIDLKNINIIEDLVIYYTQLFKITIDPELKTNNLYILFPSSISKIKIKNRKLLGFLEKPIKSNDLEKLVSGYTRSTIVLFPKDLLHMFYKWIDPEVWMEDKIKKLYAEATIPYTETEKNSMEEVD